VLYQCFIPAEPDIVQDLPNDLLRLATPGGFGSLYVDRGRSIAAVDHLQHPLMLFVAPRPHDGRAGQSFPHARHTTEPITMDNRVFPQ
jgi:hypothetical protein